MGTSFSIKLVKGSLDIDYSKIEPGVNELLVEVNRQMSTYQKDSEISRFNQYTGTDWFIISPDFAHVLQQALDISVVSDGAFDVTVGPLVNLWGFGPEHHLDKIPTDDEIIERKKWIGHNKLTVQKEPPAVKKTSAGIYIDLSAIAKGFGVDKVSQYLDSLDLNHYMVEIGGEVRVKGMKGKQHWRIGVNSPNGDALQKVLQMSKIALATSGDYFNYFEKDGVRYSHTIDPRTGRPVTHKLASVTVLHDTCMLADGFATAIDVLGPEKGYEFAIKRMLPVFMIIRDGDKFIEKMTPEFEAFVLEN